MSSPDTDQVIIRRLEPSDEPLLAAFFGRIATDPTAAGFHPHPFTAEEAARVARYEGRDLYMGLFYNDGMAGYGMLRGWDAGYEVPSLGIYLLPDARGRGLSSTMMDALHRAAFENGARRIRLKVYPDNAAAVELYQRLGYVFSETEANQLIGFLSLHSQ